MAEVRVALVTGAGRGIGREIARQLALRGLTVVAGVRRVADGDRLIRELQPHGSRVSTVILDVTDARSIMDAVADVTSRHGSVDVLVNNAGVMIDPKGSRLLDSRVDTYLDTFSTNVHGPLRLIQAVVPHMKSRGYGRIVNLSSGLGQLTDMGTGTPAYRLSKTALNAMTRIAAAELAGSNILVNAMCPGWVKTDMGGPYASRTVEQGADTAVWLATLPDDGPAGGFFRDRQPIAW